MSRQGRRDQDRALRFPRVSGDEPVAQLRSRLSDEFSPRERG